MLQRVITEVLASVTSDAKRLALCGLQHRGVTEGGRKTTCGHVTEEMRQRYEHELPVVQPPHKPHVPERGTT
jgi:hypothetical protein